MLTKLWNNWSDDMICVPLTINMYSFDFLLITARPVLIGNFCVACLVLNTHKVLYFGVFVRQTAFQF